MPVRSGGEKGGMQESSVSCKLSITFILRLPVVTSLYALRSQEALKNMDRSASGTASMRRMCMLSSSVARIVALCVDATAWRTASSCPASGTSFCNEHPTVRIPSEAGGMAAR